MDLCRNHDFPNIYRGEVVDNEDPNNKGRIKVFIRGVYPNNFINNPKALPYCEPAMSIFGGGFTSKSGSLNSETGITSVPKVGAQVFIFFEDGDHNYPIYFAISQGGDGWLSSNPNQHVLQTENVSFVFDDSSNKVLSINVKGDVDLTIEGNLTETITGDITRTHTGKYTEIHTGDKEITHTGNYTETRVGDETINVTGLGNRTYTNTYTVLASSIFLN
jgi:hypothetical protein